MNKEIELLLRNCGIDYKTDGFNENYVDMRFTLPENDIVNVEMSIVQDIMLVRFRCPREPNSTYQVLKSMEEGPKNPEERAEVVKVVEEVSEEICKIKDLNGVFMKIDTFIDFDRERMVFLKDKEYRDIAMVSLLNWMDVRFKDVSYVKMVRENVVTRLFGIAEAVIDEVVSIQENSLNMSGNFDEARGRLELYAHGVEERIQFKHDWEDVSMCLEDGTEFLIEGEESAVKAVQEMMDYLKEKNIVPRKYFDEYVEENLYLRGEMKEKVLRLLTEFYSHEQVDAYSLGMLKEGTRKAYMHDEGISFYEYMGMYLIVNKNKEEVMVSFDNKEGLKDCFVDLVLKEKEKKINKKWEEIKG